MYIQLIRVLYSVVITS